MPLPEQERAGAGAPEIAEIAGLRIRLGSGALSEREERAARRGRLRAGEIALISEAVAEGEPVLVMGTAGGLLSAAVARAGGVAWAMPETAEEAALVPETHIANGVSLPEVPTDEDPARAVAEAGATVILLEDPRTAARLAAKGALDRVRAVLLPALGRRHDEEAEWLRADAFRHAGFGPAEGGDGAGARLFLREAERGAARAPKDPASRVPVRPSRPWLPSEPLVMIVTCMKDEGPFILEWVAWHKAIGVEEIVVYSNDCTDGTERILDRLDALGIVRHRENPAVAAGSTFYQPAALDAVHDTSAFEAADFVISMDVDEFLNIRAGFGRLVDLFAAAGPFDALSVFELNHGSNGRSDFVPGLMSDLFPRHETETPGRRKAQRGVKTITRISPSLNRIRNHRPDFAAGAEAILWKDGSGRLTERFLEDAEANGADCRGGYDLAVLDHYPLRSLASYLVKMDRGDVVVEGKQVGQRYWRLRDRDEDLTSRPGPVAATARQIREVLVSDGTLARLHAEAVAAHTLRAAELWNAEGYRERRAWIEELRAEAGRQDEAG